MRRASALPVVLIVLVIAATLGGTMYFTSRGGYRSTARAAYRLRLQMFMMAALDEARTRLFQLTSPNANGLVITKDGLRQALLNRIPVPRIPWQEGDPDFYREPPDVGQVDFELPLGDFEGNPILWASRAIQFADVPNNPPEYMGRIEILEAKARLHGFRYVDYDDTGTFPSGRDYYQSLDPFDDAATWHRDYVGYCTITLHARLHATGQNPINMQRKIQVTHDVKVVDTRPPARNHALFSFRSTVGHDDRIYLALNQGGSNGNVGANGEYDPDNPSTGNLIVYPQAIGRVYIRGPYVMVTEGRTDGRGGDNPVPGPSYPGGRYSNWGGWSQVPGPRGATLPSKVSAFGGWPSPVRPEKACTQDGSRSYSAPLVQNLAAAYVDDPAGFGVSTLMAAAAQGPNRQRLHLTGDSGCYGVDHPGCSADAFRGILIHRADQLEEDSEQPMVEAWEPFYPVDDNGVPNGDIIWPSPENDSGKEKIKNYDQVRIESGPAMLGLYAVYKVYPFIAGESCPWNDWGSIGGALGNIGRGIGIGADFVSEIGTLGGIITESYRRNPADNDAGMVVNWDEAKLREVAELNFGIAQPEKLEPPAGVDPDEHFQELDPFLMILPYAMHYQSPETLGWGRAWLTLAVDVVATVAMVALPGPGLLVNAGLRGAISTGVAMGARRGARGAAVMAANRSISRAFTGPHGIAADLATMQLDMWAANGVINSLSPEDSVGDERNLQPDAISPVTQEQIDALKGEVQQAVEEERRLSAELVSGASTGESDPALEDAADQTASLKLILQAFARNGQLWDNAADALDSMMTGLPPRDPNNNLDDLRQMENFGRNTDSRQLTPTDAAYVGFLPPGLKPVQRLATRWYRKLDDALVGDRVLPLEGVIAFDEFPQEDDDAPDSPLKYTGRGMIVSTAGKDPGGENQNPTFKKGIEPLDRARDYLTLVYWSQISPDRATGQNGTGMVSLGGDLNWASVVANYGARPLGPQVAIRGNLVTYFLDRNRFPNRANLRVFYRWDMLRPDNAGDDRAGVQPSIHSEEMVRPWVSVAVSPKFAGWYDSVE